MDMIKIGPVGGSSIFTSVWDDKGRDQVGGILVYYSQNVVFSLQFMYYENGELLLSEKHGFNECEDFCFIAFDYPSEFITCISGSSGKLSQYNNPTVVLKTIKFVTNKGSYGPFGTLPMDAKHFNFRIGNRHLFGVFHGTQNGYGVESIGVYVKTNTSSIINLKVPRVKSEKEED
ncbi:inactive protein RESTRICTED TEV MOVEMENT 1-like [Lycium ferocissimum]|uniref:inactive protein RESTRICTED TEV MOVEMENT 1-like n=1 Tax=Lycium ferocissimum TaxID=112874 RepID=UPI002814E9C1|nr:inactive protein RESTRICTED TEV MOVEMENT 1-like [Lycium ferocissimum]